MRQLDWSNSSTLEKERYISPSSGFPPLLFPGLCFSKAINDPVQLTNPKENWSSTKQLCIFSLANEDAYFCKLSDGHKITSWCWWWATDQQPSEIPALLCGFIFKGEGVWPKVYDYLCCFNSCASMMTEQQQESLNASLLFHSQQQWCSDSPISAHPANFYFHLPSCSVLLSNLCSCVMNHNGWRKLTVFLHFA